jgi:hypothetical protein
MKKEKASNKVSVQWLVVGLLSLGLSGCSLQKRTTLPGWHWEHEKTAIHQGPISNAETFLKDRGRLVNLPSRRSSLQSEVDLARTLQVSAQTSWPKRDVEAMTMLVTSEIDVANQPSTFMLSSADPGKNEQSETMEKEPDEWLVAALITLGFGLMMLPSPIAGVFIGFAPFIFSLGQLVRLSRMEAAKKKKSKGKTFGYILLMLASVLATIGLTSFLAFSAVVDAAQGSGWSFSWNYTGPG